MSRAIRLLLWVVIAAGGVACRSEEPARSPRDAGASAPAPAATDSQASSPIGRTLAVPEAPRMPTPLPVRSFPQNLRGEIVFQSDVAGRVKIFLLDLAAGTIRALTEGRDWHDENPRWSPDGTRIAFASTRASYDGSQPKPSKPNYDIYVMQADGTGVTRLTTDEGNDQMPAWAPDGRSLVFSSDRDSRGDLYRVWLDDRRVERHTHHFVGRAIMPAVSPDGGRIAFAAQTLERRQFWLFQVHLLDVASNDTRPATDGGGSCWPAWSPDGRRLAYVLLDQEPSALEVQELATGARRRIVNDARLWSYYPAWSPDGRQVAFSVSPAHHEGEDWDLALVSSEGGAIVKLTAGPGNDRLPDWRPRR